MKYLKQFIQDTMFVSPMGRVDWTEGIEKGQYELTVDGKSTGIYFMAYDYAYWLDKHIQNVVQAAGNINSTVDALDSIYTRMVQQHNENENNDYIQVLKHIINTIKLFES